MDDLETIRFDDFEATHISELRRLSRPRPTIPEFRHPPLDHTIASIRLVQILLDWSPNGYVQCRMYNATIDSATYSCLSYVWGPPDSGHRILINGQRFSVRKNLAAFLQHVRLDQLEAWLWIDALCIDQDNPLERNHQVQQMGRIYSNAVEVIAWLGDDANLASYLKNLRNPWTRKDTRDEDRGGPDAFIFSKYWDRAWITQEMLLARELILMACNEYIPLRAIRWGSIRSRSIGMESRIKRLEYILRTVPEEGHFRKKGLIDLLWQYKEKECAHPRDRIFSLLSLCRLSYALQVDYEMPHEKLAANTLRACGTFCLCSTKIVGNLLGLDFFRQYHMHTLTSLPFAKAVLPLQVTATQPDRVLLKEERDSKRKITPTYTIPLSLLCRAYAFGRIKIWCVPGSSKFSYAYSDLEYNKAHMLGVHISRYRARGIWISHDMGTQTCRIVFSLAFLVEISRYHSEEKSNRANSIDSVSDLKRPVDGLDYTQFPCPASSYGKSGRAARKLEILADAQP